MTIDEVRISAGKAGNLDLPLEIRQALNLRDSDQVEVIVRRKRFRADLTAEEIRLQGRKVAEFIKIQCSQIASDRV